MLMLDRLQWTRKCQDLALQQSLSTQRWSHWLASFKAHQHTAFAVGMPLHC
jgi:hypothetical protein